MRDNLPKLINKNECGVVNLDSIRNQGTHWVCYYKKENVKYYFDSFGLDPPKEVVKYLGKNILLNTFQIQKPNTSICGHICLHVLNELSKRRDFKGIVIELI